MPCCDPDFEESVFHQVQYVSIPLNSTLHSTSLKWPFQDKLCRFLHHWCHSLTCIHVRLHTIHLYILFCKRTGFLSHKGTLIAGFYKKNKSHPIDMLCEALCLLAQPLNVLSCMNRAYNYIRYQVLHFISQTKPCNYY